MACRIDSHYCFFNALLVIDCHYLAGAAPVDSGKSGMDPICMHANDR